MDTSGYSSVLELKTCGFESSSNQVYFFFDLPVSLSLSLILCIAGCIYLNLSYVTNTAS